jgi:rRNA maturation endonuclease Nob1
MRCPKCQNEVPFNEQFCSHCGTPISKHNNTGPIFAIICFLAVIIVGFAFTFNIFIKYGINYLDEKIATVETTDETEEDNTNDDDEDIIIDDDDKTFLTKEEYLKGIIELPSEDYDIEEAKNIIERLSRFDIKFLKLMYEYKGKIILTAGPITDDYRFKSLKGIVPRGWENTGSTWDDVPGAGGYPYTIVRIGKSFPSYENNHNAIVLELHETSHMIDQILNSISNDEEFKQITIEESENLFPDSDYLDIPEEYWAECLAYYTYNQETHNKLKTKCPKTYSHFVNLIGRL